MANDYAPRQFLRQIQIALLQAYFDNWENAGKVEWDKIQEAEIESVYEMWIQLPEPARMEVDSDFRRIHIMGTPEGTQAIIEEGGFHYMDLTPDLDSLEGHLNKALWTFLNHEKIFRVAERMYRADHLSKRYWRKRKDIPKRNPDISQNARADLAKAIEQYYWERQGRGSPCCVEAYLRGDRYHYFFVYPRDYADTFTGYDDKGQFERRPWNPAFEIIYVYDLEDGSLELYVQGDKNIVRDLQKMFGQAILHEELDEEKRKNATYELNGLKSRSFVFQTDLEDDVQEVRVSELKLAMVGNPRDKIIFEAGDRNKPKDAIYDLMETVLHEQRVPLSSFYVNSVVIMMSFKTMNGEGAEGKTLKFRISYPNFCNLGDSEEELVAKKCLKDWKIERRDPLTAVWVHADAREARFSWDEVSAWPDDHERLLTEAEIIQYDDNANTVICDACQDGHVEKVEMIRSHQGTSVRAYITCPEAGRVPVALSRLRQWVINFSGMANAVSTGLGLAGAVEEIVLSRLWSVGKGTLGGQSREVFLARGTRWSDAPGIFSSCERLNAARGALVLVPGDVPPKAVWSGDSPYVVQLKMLVRLENGRLAFDQQHLESQLTGSKRKKPVQAIESFPTPPGSGWNDVRALVGEWNIVIEVKRRRREVTFQKAGFEDSKKGIPDEKWGLLKDFALYGGVISLNDTNLESNLRNNLKSYVSILRKRIRALIPNIEGDPIPYINKEKCYRMAFKISNLDGMNFPVPEGTEWPIVAITLTKSDTIRVSVPTTERFAAYRTTKGPDGDSRELEAAERETKVEREYDLRMLRLAGEDGRPNAQGVAFLAILHGQGDVTRDQDDETMLELCGILSKLMDGVESSPFDFAPTSRKWIAKFQASSELE